MPPKDETKNPFKFSWFKELQTKTIDNEKWVKLTDYDELNEENLQLREKIKSLSKYLKL